MPLGVLSKRKPEFSNVLRVLNRQVPERPTLFEFFLNESLYRELSGMEPQAEGGSAQYLGMVVAAYANAGYDYAPVGIPGFGFPTKPVAHKSSRGMSDTAIITDWDSFRAYPWQDPAGANHPILDELAKALPDGMKMMAYGPGGVLENVMWLIGFEPLCYMLMDDPKLVEAVFEEVGSRLVRYYEIVGAYSGVGWCMSNDDWGFNTQTMLSPADMRKHVFPWHKKIVEAIHAHGKPATLHSCGNLTDLMDEIVDELGYDGKHSYEDGILPVEEAYEKWGSRIAILGGIDVDFVCRRTPEEIYARAKALLERTAGRGGYALGTGNSVPAYVPKEGYYAMISAAHD